MSGDEMNEAGWLKWAQMAQICKSVTEGVAGLAAALAATLGIPCIVRHSALAVPTYTNLKLPMGLDA